MNLATDHQQYVNLTLESFMTQHFSTGTTGFLFVVEHDNVADIDKLFRALVKTLSNPDYELPSDILSIRTLPYQATAN